MSKVKRFYAPGLDCLYRSDADAPRQLIALVLGSDYDALAAKLAMAEDAAAKGDAARQQCGGMEMEIEELRAELAELRARVVVVPEHKDDLPPIYEDENLPAFHHYKGWNACLDELARLNGLTVSEALLRRLCEPLLSHADYVVARNELRALLGEEKEHE
ncbi:TPA: hypothetical protein ACKRWG_003039 [Pseudomonas aeruginosa]|uniref:hypothetical protein n=1 Tax=Pseudomonas aeruginosa TaxID=287 RepID=UPI0029D7AC9C|nr:hypothetical protein [Pseudomonas aeruginosa]